MHLCEANILIFLKISNLFDDYTGTVLPSPLKDLSKLSTLNSF